MPSFLEVTVVIAGVLVGCVLLFVVQSLISPKLISGTLSEPILQPCLQGRQWVIYDCLTNPITGIGCVIPNTGLVTRKRIAINNPTCAPQSDGNLPGDRIVSFQWQQQGEAGPCSSTGTSPPCCNYNESCTSTVNYICVRTSQPEGGENQCSPQFLPIHDIPDYDSRNITPVTQEVPCRMNYCHT